MDYHLLWLWFWFLIGMATYMLKRAYYLVTGPNPIASGYGEFFRRCWIPLLVRAMIDGGIYWATFTPQLLGAGLEYLGWSRFHNAVVILSQFGVFAFFFGIGVDSLADFGVSKVPFFKDFLPQMPGPIKP